MKETELKYDPEEKESLIDENSVLVLSRGNLAELQRKFEEVIGPTAHSIIYKSAKKYANNMESNIKKSIINLWSKLSIESVAKRMKKQFELWGYGEMEIIEIDKSNSHAKIRVENSANAEGYENSEEPVCHFTRGMIAGASTILMGEKMDCKENKCIGKGDSHCEFEIMPEEEYKSKIE